MDRGQRLIRELEGQGWVLLRRGRHAVFRAPDGATVPLSLNGGGGRKEANRAALIQRHSNPPEAIALPKGIKQVTVMPPAGITPEQVVALARTHPEIVARWDHLPGGYPARQRPQDAPDPHSGSPGPQPPQSPAAPETAQDEGGTADMAGQPQAPTRPAAPETPLTLVRVVVGGWDVEIVANAIPNLPGWKTGDTPMSVIVDEIGRKLIGPLTEALTKN